MASRDFLSDDADVLCLITFAAGADVELDTLTLVKGPVSGALDVRVMDEDIFALFTGDESVALLGVEELYGTCSQLSLSSLSGRSQ